MLNIQKKHSKVSLTLLVNSKQWRLSNICSSLQQLVLELPWYIRGVPINH